jgi:hypothetical protein
MAATHPGPDLLGFYARGELAPGEARALERHLMACVTCQREIDRLPSRPGTVVRWRGHRFAPSESSPEASSTRPPRDGTLAAFGEILATTGEAAAAQLLSQPEHRRRALIRRESRFHTLSLCELLEARCRAAWLDEPADSVEYAKLAVLIAQRLDERLYGLGRLEKVRAVAWVHLGTAFRMAAIAVLHGGEKAGLEEDGSYPAGAVAGSELRERSGRLAEAETALRETREALLERDMGWDAALVTLELAGAYLREGREWEIPRLASEARDLLASHGAPAYALEAMRTLREAAEGKPKAGEIGSIGRLTPELLDAMTRLLLRRRSRPESRFDRDR